MSIWNEKRPKEAHVCVKRDLCLYKETYWLYSVSQIPQLHCESVDRQERGCETEAGVSPGCCWALPWQLQAGVAVCCSVLQCVAVCCSVLQYVVVCCSVLQCVAVCCSLPWVLPSVSLTTTSRCCSVLQCVAVRCSPAGVSPSVSLCRWKIQGGFVVCCSMLLCGAVCCSVLHCVAVCCSVLQCVAVCCSPPGVSPSIFENYNAYVRAHAHAYT